MLVMMTMKMTNDGYDDGDEDEAEDDGHDGDESIHSNMVDGKDACATAILSLTSVVTATVAIKYVTIQPANMKMRVKALERVQSVRRFRP